jgi:hypothetical protein
MFYRKGFGAGRAPENRMLNVDFTRARFRWTTFRGLDLDTVKLPSDDMHLIIEDFPHKLTKLLNYFKTRDDPGSKRICGLLEAAKKWLGSRQKIGLFSKADIVEIARNDGLERFVEVLDRLS